MRCHSVLSEGAERCFCRWAFELPDEVLRPLRLSQVTRPPSSRGVLHPQAEEEVESDSQTSRVLYCVIMLFACAYAAMAMTGWASADG